MTLITLTTDFGTADYFVGAMKGAILSVNPSARIVDITHEIPPQDIRAAGFTLMAAYDAFPKGTLHVAVVDPGVGSMRQPLLVEAAGHFFIGPDNGLFSFLFEGNDVAARVYQLSNDKYFRHPVSTTFHGRDVFASVAGAFSMGVRPDELGFEVNDYIRHESPVPAWNDRDNSWAASIIHIDRFGNCVTNLTRLHVKPEMFERGARILVNEVEIKSHRRFYAQRSDDASLLFGIMGSAGFLEIVAEGDSAARLLGVERGQRIVFLAPPANIEAKK